jgi:hypothetical protein
MNPLSIQEVYKKFEVMPQLQEHMLRVAAVGQAVCQASPLPINQSNVIEACLLHDLGNIIKFDLTKFPEFLEPEGLDHWKNVQNDFFARYGFDEHVATLMMAKDIGVKPEVYALVKAIGFNEFMTEVNLEKPWYELWACEYADMRVTPTGVVSLGQRVADLEERYGKKYHHPDHVAKRQQFHEIMKHVESELFAKTTIKPSDINDSSIASSVIALKNYILSRSKA